MRKHFGKRDWFSESAEVRLSFQTDFGANVKKEEA